MEGVTNAGGYPMSSGVIRADGIIKMVHDYDVYPNVCFDSTHSYTDNRRYRYTSLFGVPVITYGAQPLWTLRTYIPTWDWSNNAYTYNPCEVWDKKRVLAKSGELVEENMATETVFQHGMGSASDLYFSNQSYAKLEDGDITLTNHNVWRYVSTKSTYDTSKYRILRVYYEITSGPANSSSAQHFRIGLYSGTAAGLSNYTAVDSSNFNVGNKGYAEHNISFYDDSLKVSVGSNNVGIRIPWIVLLP